MGILLVSADDLKSDDHSEPLPDDLQAEADALLAEIDAPLPAADVDSPGVEQAKTADMLSTLLQITFNAIVAPRRGDHWAMSQKECDALGSAYGAVIDKYFPDFDLGVEFVAVVTTVTVFGPRIAQDIATPPADDSEPEKEEPTASIGE